MNAVRLLKPHFANISIEVQPLSEEEYRQLHDAGVNAVLVYQETYHQEVYKEYHPKGKKSNFNFRLETPDRIGKAGIHKMGLGVLLGLEDWRIDSFFNALHIDYLQKKSLKLFIIFGLIQMTRCLLFIDRILSYPLLNRPFGTLSGNL